jgi:AcrR family transcriptional regulator
MVAGRPYDMQNRARARAATRERTLAVACGLLRGTHYRELTLEAVAAAAGVTRVTVYNHFGSRRGLLLAVFGELGRRMRAERIQSAMREPDAQRALARVLVEAARAWRRERRAVSRIFALAALDPDVRRAVARSERARRTSLAYLARRLGEAGALGVSRAEATAQLGALTSFQVFEALSTAGASRVEARLAVLARSALGGARVGTRRAR